MCSITLIRGCPGSGKSTLANSIMANDLTLTDAKHLEADQYFIHPDGRYIFDANKLRFAHEYCQLAAQTAIDRGESIIVSNTFIKMREMQFYLDLVKPGIKLTVYRMTKQYTNVHGVPPEKVALMIQNMVDYPGEILV